MTYPLSKNKSGGYIALITILLMSFVLLIISVTVGSAGFLGRFSQLDYENKRVSASLAEACVDVAILDLIKGTPTFPKTVSVGIMSCEICDIQNPTTDPTIFIQAVHSSSYTNLSVDLAKVGSKFFITDWDELVSHTSGTCTF